MLLGKRLVRLATFTSKLLSQLPSLLLGTSSSHYTPEQRLVQAICQGKLYTAQELLSRRQPPDLTAAVICHQFWIPEPCSHLGFYSPVSPLAVAVSLTASEPEAVQLVQLLVQRGALPTLHDYFHDHTGEPLHSEPSAGSTAPGLGCHCATATAGSAPHTVPTAHCAGAEVPPQPPARPGPTCCTACLRVY